MLNINILSYVKHNLFEQQIDEVRFKDCNFYQNSELDIIWDIVVVFEDINKPFKLKYKNPFLIFMSAEPPTSSTYPKKFLQQFSKCYIAHKKYVGKRNFENLQIFNDWHIGLSYITKTHQYNFETIKNFKDLPKTKNISVITSSLAQLPFHIKRLEFLDKLKIRYESEIDFYGRGFNFIDDKAEALIPYKFHICIENEPYKNIWTEKLTDPILALALPLYIGCTNVNDYLPKQSVVKLDINNINETFNVIDEILQDPDKFYKSRLDDLVEAKYLIMNQYNIIPEIIHYYYNNDGDKCIQSSEVSIMPKYFFKTYKYLNGYLRFKRLFYRIIKKFHFNYE